MLFLGIGRLSSSTEHYKTFLKSTHINNIYNKILKGVETSEDELEMPVLEAEVPFPTTPLSKAPLSPMSQGLRPGTQASPNPSRSMQLPLSQARSK